MRKGTDTEVFLRNSKTGEFISSVGLIGGTKHEPLPIGRGCALQEDNVTVEYNTPPCKNAEEFRAAIKYNLDTIAERVATMGLSVAITPSANFSEKELDSQGAQTFGCEPDYNAWNGGQENPRPECEDSSLRSAGGHIHIELEPGEDPIPFVKAFDLFVGCPLIRVDTDQKRRLLYGKAGAFRPKPYGFEYRTPSNAWTRSDALISWVWAQTDAAVDFVRSGRSCDDDASDIQECINSGKLTLLVKLVNKYGLHEAI